MPKIVLNKEEMEKLDLTEVQYLLFRKFMDETPIKDLPSELKEFYKEKTEGLPIGSQLIDHDWTIEIFSDFIRGREYER